MSRGLRDADALGPGAGHPVRRDRVRVRVSPGLGVASGHRGLVVIAGLILAEELYETGTLALIIRIGGKAAPLPGPAPLPGRAALSTAVKKCGFRLRRAGQHRDSAYTRVSRLAIPSQTLSGTGARPGAAPLPAEPAAP